MYYEYSGTTLSHPSQYLWVHLFPDASHGIFDSDAVDCFQNDVHIFVHFDGLWTIISCVSKICQVLQMDRIRRSTETREKGQAWYDRGQHRPHFVVKSQQRVGKSSVVI